MQAQDIRLKLTYSVFLCVYTNTEITNEIPDQMSQPPTNKRPICDTDSGAHKVVKHPRSLRIRPDQYQKLVSSEVANSSRLLSSIASIVGAYTIGIEPRVFSTSGAFAAIMPDCTVVAWGESDRGGDTSKVDEYLVQVKTIHSNEFAFVAELESGLIVAWGDERWGGDCGAVADELQMGVRMVVPRRRGFVVLTRGGRVVEWGRKQNADAVHVQMPVGLKGVSSLHVTAYATVAVTEDGDIVAWGARWSGGDTGNIRPLRARVVEIKSSRYAFAALLTDGTSVSWGQSGHGVGMERDTSQTHQRVDKLYAADTVFAVRTVDGEIGVWGTKIQGTIENLHASGREFTLEMADGRILRCGSEHVDMNNVCSGIGSGEVAQVWSNGRATATRMTDGSLRTHGMNIYGGDCTDLAAVLGGTSWTAIPNDNAFAVLQEGGKVHTWGNKVAGGDSSAVQSLLVGVVAVYSSARAFAAVLHTGEIVTWGDGMRGGDSTRVCGLYRR